jgi:hypothetical protein
VQVLAAGPVGAAFGEHGARLVHRSLSSVPAVLMLAAESPLPVVACSNYFGMPGLRDVRTLHLQTPPVRKSSTSIASRSPKGTLQRAKPTDKN